MTHLHKKNADMLAMEEAFQDIKSKQNVDSNLRTIERLLKRQFDLTFSISVVENKTSEFFGMSIFPNRNLVETMVDHLINQRSKLSVLEKLWSDNKEWVLEIDSITLYDMNLNTNPAELVAILLHEVGHVVMSNTVPARVYKVLRYELLHLSFAVKKMITWKKAQRLLDLVLVEACSTKNYHFLNQQKEVAADNFVIKMGYGDNLNQFVQKVINTQSNRLVNRSEKDLERDVRSVVNWTVINIGELEFRRTKLRSTFRTELMQNPSNYVRSMIYDLKASFFGGTTDDQYTEMLKEQNLVKESVQVVQEGIRDLFDKLGKMPKIQQSELDIIEVEKSRIVNQDDKIYVLDLIYDKMDRIDVALDLQKRKSDKVQQSKDTLTRFRTQLEKLRKEVLDVQIKDRQYGVFIKYPKGYEG